MLSWGTFAARLAGAVAVRPQPGAGAVEDGVGLGEGSGFGGGPQEEVDVHAVGCGFGPQVFESVGGGRVGPDQIGDEREHALRVRIGTWPGE